MTWVKLDDGFVDHPKVLALSDRAFRAHVRAMCYASRFDTDGYLTPNVIATLAPPRVVRELIDGAVWDQNGAGCVIHDWLDYHPPSEPAARRRWHDAERQRRRRAPDA